MNLDTVKEYANIDYILISCFILLIIVYSFAFFVRKLQIPSKVPISMQKVLIITAHPDDECMFFSPTIQALLNAGHFVHVLCLSNGKFHPFLSSKTFYIELHKVIYMHCHNDSEHGQIVLLRIGVPIGFSVLKSYNGEIRTSFLM